MVRTTDAVQCQDETGAQSTNSAKWERFARLQLAFLASGARQRWQQTGPAAQELRQPKTGVTAFQAAMQLGLPAGDVSRLQPGCTSMRLSAIQSETAKTGCEKAPDKLQGRCCKKSNTRHKADSTRRCRK